MWAAAALGPGPVSSEASVPACMQSKHINADGGWRQDLRSQQHRQQWRVIHQAGPRLASPISEACWSTTAEVSSGDAAAGARGRRHR
jgi:hypothetical protein